MRHDMIAVVIPFYQRDTGVLSKTLRSVFAQTHLPDEIIIVDDGSPVPAAEEVAAVENPPASIDIRVLAQPNSGPGAARNRGLDAVRPDTEFVAFLDSDDRWTADHLQTAMKGLQSRNADFYFADRSDVHGGESQFEGAGYPRVTEDGHSLIDRELQIHLYDGSSPFSDLIRKMYVPTSTVVYRYAQFSAVRFREELFNGQDLLFFLDILVSSPPVVFSPRVTCSAGQGINIWAGAIDWRSDKVLHRTLNAIRFVRAILRDFDLTRDQHVLLRRRLMNLRTEAMRCFLHRVRRGGLFGRGFFVKAMTVDKPLVFWAVPLSIGITTERLVRRRRDGH